MAVAGPNGTSHNFNPDSYEVPNFNKDKDGNYDPSTYQAALGFRKFMHDNHLPFVSEKQVNEAVNKGSITIDDARAINLNDQEKAMFRRVMENGLFNRLDAGTTNTQDGWVGIQDINDAVRQSWKLHGNEVSKNGNWSEPFSQSKMTTDEAKKIVLEQMEGQKWPHIYDTAIREFLNTQRILTKDGPVDADPKFLEALFKLGKEFGDIDTDGDHRVTDKEIRNWGKV